MRVCGQLTIQEDSLEVSMIEFSTTKWIPRDAGLLSIIIKTKPTRNSVE